MREMPIRSTLFLLLVVLPLSGCAALAVGSAAGSTGYAVYQGASSTYYPHGLAQTQAAAQSVLQRMDVALLKTSRNPDGSMELHGKKNTGGVLGPTLVDISISPRGADVTKVTVRFGLLGDKKDDTRFHKYMEDALG